MTPASTTTEFAGAPLAAAGADEARIARIGLGDIAAALRAGWTDFLETRTHYAFLFLLYPAIGAVVTYAAFDYDLMPLVFPLIAGFALVAPIAAVGLYEISRRREAGLSASVADMGAILAHPSRGGILAVALLLLGLFVVWVVAAQQIVHATLGRDTPAGLAEFATRVATTPEGWTMFLLGNGIGALFAVAAAAVSVLSLPMLVDGEPRASAAVATSLAAIARNPVAFLAWGIVVAGLLVIAMLPLFAGLLVALPWLGHATWHLYRRTVRRA